MRKETLLSFILALCVVGGSLFLFARFSGGVPQARAATQPAADTAAPPPAVAACPDGDKAKCPAEKTAQSAAGQQRVAEAAQAQVDAPEDEAAAPTAIGKPRCKAISHQVFGIDGALASPLSPAVRDFYTKQRQSLQEEKAGLAC